MPRNRQTWSLGHSQSPIQEVGPLKACSACLHEEQWEEESGGECGEKGFRVYLMPDLAEMFCEVEQQRSQLVEGRIATLEHRMHLPMLHLSQTVLQNRFSHFEDWPKVLPKDVCTICPEHMLHFKPCTTAVRM